MLYSRIVLFANGALFAFYGAYLLFWPANLADTLFLDSPSAVALTEFRAMYGGLELALGGLLVWWGVRTPFIWNGLMLLTVMGASLFCGRMLGLALDGSGGEYLMSAAIYEGVATLLGGIGLWREYRHCLASCAVDAPAGPAGSDSS